VKPGRIKAITFDVGGTLIDPWPSVGAVYASVAKDFGIECCPDTLTNQFIHSWGLRERFGYTRSEWREVVRHSFHGQAEISEELFTAIYDHFAESKAWLIYEDVIPTLQRLEEAGFVLAAISNWDDRLIPLLEKLGLRPYFKEIVVSATVGAHKPDRLIFEHCAKRISFQPDEILHVGDSAREDIEGAMSAGFSALRIRRAGAIGPGEMQRLTELFLKELVRPLPVALS
jgi:putative hydrolase of the HAD superfamily